MIGAIIGDIVGSPYEFDRGEKKKDFGPLFIDESEYTDDSVDDNCRSRWPYESRPEL